MWRKTVSVSIIVGSCLWITNKHEPFLSEALKQQLKITQRAAYAEGTFKNLEIQWSKYLEFCQEFKCDVMPADVETICLYAQYLSNQFKAPQSVKNYINGVRVLHALNDHPVSAFKSFELNLTLKGIARLKAHTPRQAAPITPEILLAMSNFVGSTTTDIVAWAAILTAFFCMLRKSNLVPTSAHHFDPKKQLKKKDILLNKQSALVDIHWSKTIQFAERALTIPMLVIPGSPLCPVSALKRMRHVIHSEPDQPAFSIGGSRALTYRECTAKLKQWLEQAGWDGSKFSMHSLRRGGATLAFKAKVPGELIKLQGDWASESYLRYLSIPLEQRTDVAAQIRDLVMSTH